VMLCDLDMPVETRHDETLSRRATEISECAE
jgi:hypothetical protein